MKNTHENNSAEKSDHHDLGVRFSWKEKIRHTLAAVLVSSGCGYVSHQHNQINELTQSRDAHKKQYIAYKNKHEKEETYTVFPFYQDVKYHPSLNVIDHPLDLSEPIDVHLNPSVEMGGCTTHQRNQEVIDMMRSRDRSFLDTRDGTTTSTVYGDRYNRFPNTYDREGLYDFATNITIRGLIHKERSSKLPLTRHAFLNIVEALYTNANQKTENLHNITPILETQMTYAKKFYNKQIMNQCTSLGLSYDSDDKKGLFQQYDHFESLYDSIQKDNPHYTEKKIITSGDSLVTKMRSIVQDLPTPSLIVLAHHGSNASYSNSITNKDLKSAPVHSVGPINASHISLDLYNLSLEGHNLNDVTILLGNCYGGSTAQEIYIQLDKLGYKGVMPTIITENDRKQIGLLEVNGESLWRGTFPSKDIITGSDFWDSFNSKKFSKYNNASIFVGLSPEDTKKLPSGVRKRAIRIF